MLSADRAAQALVEGSLAVTDAELERFYRDNPAHFHRPEQLRLRVLQVRAAPGARERIREHLAQARGREVLDREVAALRAASKVEVLLPQ